MHRPLVMLSVGVALAVAAWLGVRMWEARRFRDDLALARGVHGAAVRMPPGRGWSGWPSAGPATARSGSCSGDCERMLGHPDAALAAWGRIPEDAAQAPQAALSSGRMALGLGRYRLAETGLLRASRAGGDVADEAWRLLEVLYWMTGRREEHRAILQARAEQEVDPSRILRMLGASTAILIRSIASP